MPADMSRILETAQNGFAAQETELSARRAEQVRSVTTRTATGAGDIDETFSLDTRFRLVFVRGHFAGSAGTAPLSISIDSAKGAAYAAGLFTITQAGTNRDVNLRIGDGDNVEPSAWTFQAGDKLRIQWTNPDSGNITWGLEVGLVMAS